MSGLALKSYVEYRESKLPGAGRVPSHWRSVPGFGAYREKHVRNSGMQEKTVLSLSYGRIIVRSEDRLTGLVPESFETYQIVDPGDIVIRATDLQNDKTSLRVGFVRNRGIITSAYLNLKTTNELLPEYGYLLIHTLDLTKMIYGLGSGLRQNLSYSNFKRLPIFIPPQEEQAAIVRFVDSACGRLDRAIRAKRKIITLLDEQRQAIIHGTIVRGLDPVVVLKPSGLPWFGEVPAHWQVFALKHALRKLIDCEHKTAPAANNSDLRVVRTTGIRKGKLLLEGTYGTTREAFEAWTRRGVPEPGDVLFTREAPAGEACVAPAGVSICMGQRTVLMKLRRDQLDPHFLVHMIYGGPPQVSIALASQGSTVGHFNMSDIGSLPIFLPPIDEQEEIVRAISEATSPLDIAIARNEREISLIREYRARLIADAVTGKIDVREVARSAEITTEEGDALSGEVAEAGENVEQLVGEED